MKISIFKLLLLFCFTIIFIGKRAAAQTLDSTAIQKIGKKLISNAISEFYGKDTLVNDNCVRDTSGMWLSCFTAESKPEYVTDFDKDGNPDIVFHFLDEGLGGGGNAFGYEYLLLLLDEKQQIKKQYNIFGGGKLSYGQLAIDEVKNGKIFATYEENVFATRGNWDDTANLNSISLVFYLQGDTLTEQSYKACPLAALQKKIFKDCDTCTIQRSTHLDDSYNVEAQEQLKLNDHTAFHASLSGCENLELYFSRTVPFNAKLKSNKKLIQQYLWENIEILSQQTLYSSLMKQVLQNIKMLPLQNIVMDKYGGSATHMVLQNGWKAMLFTSGNEEQGSFITIRYVKNASKATSEEDFWETIQRKKSLPTKK
jgi:hypothetical protein